VALLRKMTCDLRHPMGLSIVGDIGLSACRALLSVCTALLSVCRAVVSVWRAVLSVYKALLSDCRGLLSVLPSSGLKYRAKLHIHI